jgi:glycosyltransferase involved in cell wall biosynthesis
MAWFTPMSKQSAIGRFSVAVTASLAKLADVEICCFDLEDIREADVPVRRFPSSQPITAETMGLYDVVIYNFGNYLPFHREIYPLSRQFPGVCILHDFVMHHFFASYYLDHLRNPPLYERLLQTTYGSVASAADRIWETDAVVRFPLFEEATRGAVGIVTHSEFFQRRVEATFAGPVARIPLAYTTLAYTMGTSGTNIARAKLGIGRDEILIVTVGHANPNKQIERVIEALARLGSTARGFVYAILGPASPEYERQLKALGKIRGLMHSVRLLGQVSDDLLNAYLSAADICINLRFPAMEGASASVIEEMLFGKPVIVTDTGFFSELPDDCVTKVRPDSDADLTAALNKLMADESLRLQMGAAAKLFAESEFRADNYAKKLLDFVWEARVAGPLLGLADRVGVELARIGVDRTAKVLDSLALEIEGAFVSDARDASKQRRPSGGSL